MSPLVSQILGCRAIWTS